MQNFRAWDRWGSDSEQCELTAAVRWIPSPSARSGLVTQYWRLVCLVRRVGSWLKWSCGGAPRPWPAGVSGDAHTTTMAGAVLCLQRRSLAFSSVWLARISHGFWPRGRQFTLSHHGLPTVLAPGSAGKADQRPLVAHCSGCLIPSSAAKSTSGSAWTVAWYKSEAPRSSTPENSRSRRLHSSRLRSDPKGCIATPSDATVCVIELFQIYRKCGSCKEGDVLQRWRTIRLDLDNICRSRKLVRFFLLACMSTPERSPTVRSVLADFLAHVSHTHMRMWTTTAKDDRFVRHFERTVVSCLCRSRTLPSQWKKHIVERFDFSTVFPTHMPAVLSQMIFLNFPHARLLKSATLKFHALPLGTNRSRLNVLLIAFSMLCNEDWHHLIPPAGEIEMCVREISPTFMCVLASLKIPSLAQCARRYYLQVLDPMVLGRVASGGKNYRMLTQLLGREFCAPGGIINGVLVTARALGDRQGRLVPRSQWPRGLRSNLMVNMVHAEEAGMQLVVFLWVSRDMCLQQPVVSPTGLTALKVHALKASNCLVVPLYQTSPDTVRVVPSLMLNYPRTIAPFDRWIAASLSQSSPA